MKRFGRTFCGIAFKLLLVFVAVLAAVSIVFGTPKYLKIALADNNVYSSAVDSLIDEVEKSSQKDQSGSFPITNPSIQQAIKNAFPAATIQSAGENVIEGVYGWLSGDTKTPEFSVNLNESKQKLAEGISTVAAVRLETLPVCTYAQLQALGGGDIDPFTVPCLPPGINIAQEKQRLVDEIANNKEFLDKTSLSAADLPKNEGGQTIVEQVSAAPTVFQLARATPILVGILLLLLGALWILLFDDRWRGAKVMSFTLLGAGLFLLIMFGVLGWLFNKANETGGVLSQLNDNAFSKSMTGVATDLTAQTNRVILWFAIAYIVLGGAVWLALKFIFKKPGPDQPKPDKQETSEATVTPKSNEVIEGTETDKKEDFKDNSEN